VGSLLVVLTPDDDPNPGDGRSLGPPFGRQHKAGFRGLYGRCSDPQGGRVLQSYRVPNYQVPERAVAAMAAMWHHRQWLNTPPLATEPLQMDRDAVRRVLDRVRAEDRVTIGDTEAREILEAARIGLPKSELAKTADDAVAAAEAIGYPVVMKIASPDILHKTDIGGIKLNITSAGDVRDAFDLLTYRARRYMPDATIWGCQVQQMVKGGREVYHRHEPGSSVRSTPDVRVGRHLRGSAERRHFPRGAH